MNKPFKTLFILAYSIVVLCLYSCKEDEGNEPNPDEGSTTTTCYITEQVESFPKAATILYEYDESNNVSMAISGTETTTFEYDNDKLSVATNGSTVSTFIYIDGTTMLERINQQKDGEDVSYIFIEHTDDEVTKIETHNTASGDDIVETVTNIAYSDGNISSLETQKYNTSTTSFETEFKLTSIETDDKVNPFSTSLAYFFMNTTNPKAVGKHNIIKGTAQYLSFPATYEATIEYNEHNYATGLNAKITNAAATVDAPTTLKYDCK